MIKQVSFIPFDLGFVPDFEKLKKLNFDDFIITELTNMEKSLIGIKTLSFKSKNSKHCIYLNYLGFGILVTTLNTYKHNLTSKVIPRVLLDRRNSHCEIIDGKNKINSTISKFINKCRLTTNRKCYLRESMWDSIPYVMSIYICNQSNNYINDDDKSKSLIALIEPSSIGIEDTGFINIDGNIEKYIHLTNNLDTGNYQEILKDIDIDNSKSCFMSWANVVILGENVFLDEKIYISLEVRIQLAWTMSYYTNLWCEFLLERDDKYYNIEQIEWDLTKMYQQTDKIIDSTVATRYQNILNKMIETSLLREQVSKLKQSLEYLNKYSAYLKTKADKKYTIIIEIAVFTFAFIQSVPLFFQLPFIQGNKLLIFQIGYLVIFFSFIIVYYLKSKNYK